MADPDDDLNRAKLREISAKLQAIQQHKAAEAAASDEKRAESSAWSQGAEFVGAVVVGVGIGYWIDQHFGTGPWAMIILLVIGFAAGTMNALRFGKSAEAEPDKDKKETIKRG